MIPPSSVSARPGAPRSPGFARLAVGAALLLAASLPVSGAPRPLETRLSRADRVTLQQEALIVIQLLQGYHYASRPFHELEAPEFLDRYLARIDSAHLFLTAADVEFIHRRFDRNLKAVYLFSGDLRPAFEIFDLFSARALARCDWVEARLQQPIALDRPGALAPDRDQAAWPADAAAADALWEQWLQLELGGELLDGRTLEQAVARARERNARFRARIVGADPLAVREQFFTCLLEFFDPHSGYFSRANADEFNIEMAGAVAGIGLDLRAVDGRFFVESVYPGGPCDQLGTVNPGDELLAIAEAAAAPKPLAGLRLREVVRLARGAPGSVLTLSVRPAGAASTPVSIELTRSRIELPASHASGFLLHVPSGAGATPVGLIRLPAFYGSRPGDATETSMAADVRELLERFAARDARAIVIDLRDNGGGLMLEAARLAGLFLEGGPLVHSQGTDARPETLRDETPTAAFAGPVVVLTSRQSASASEAFAGAMQCYGRALIVGGETTFGKGTAQSYIDIRDLTNVSPALQRLGGVARVTRQLYYLPDGRSPQLAGVASDIVLPTFVAPGDRTESQLPHALPATAIPPPEPMPVLSPRLAQLTPALLQTLRTRTAERLAALPEFALRQRWLAFYREVSGETALALPLEQRRQQAAARETQRNELRAERLRIGAQSAFPAERIDLALVAAARDAHQSALRHRRTLGGEPCANRYDRGVFYHQAEGGPIRAIPLAALDLADCRAAAATLAEAWTTATGISLQVDQVKALLADLAHQREFPDPAVDLPALMRRQLAQPLDGAALAAGLTAFVRAALVADGDQLRDLPLLDTSLRESLRLAADWAESAPPPPATETATPLAPSLVQP